MTDTGLIRSFVNRGRGGTFWLALKNFTNNKEVDAGLQQLGYRLFRGSYTKQIVPDNLEDVRTELNNLASSKQVNIDLSALDNIIAQINITRPETQQTTGVTNTTQQLSDFMTQLKDEMSKTTANEQAQMMGDMIEKRIEQLAASTDEAAKSEFIKQFFAFSAKFWKYSFTNQMLIFFQTEGKATYVRGKKQWEEMGRQVKDGEGGISILAPAISRGKVTSKAIGYVLRFVQTYNRNNPGQQDLNKPDIARKFYGMSKRSLYPQNHRYLIQLVKDENIFNTNELEAILEQKAVSGETASVPGTMRFKPVLVYDIAQTDPIPGMKAFEPPSKDIWQSKFNEPEGRANALIAAAASFAAKKGIDIDLAEDTGRAGGYAEPGRIAIHYKSEGQRKLGTIIHEIAHELLHWDPATRKNFTKQDKEVDAESVAFIVMTHFGYTADYAANYLAMHGAGSKEIKLRKDYIARAVKEIITGIRTEILGEEKNALARGWYKMALRKSLPYLEIIPEIASEMDHLVIE